MLGGGQSVPMRPTLNLADLASAATARTNLGVDPAGTDNSTPVTLAGALDYLTLSGQQITRNAIDMTTDVTGALPVANGGTGATTAANARTNLGVGAGDSPSFTGLDLTGITDDGLLRLASGGVVKSSILETSTAPYLSPNKALRVLVPSFGTVATPVVTDAICGHADEVTDTVTNPAALSFANMFSANNGVHVDIYSRRTASADRILNTRHMANGGIQLAQCVTADPTGVAGTIQLYGDVTNGHAMIREGTGTAYRPSARLTQAASQTSSFNVAAGNEYPVDLSGGTDITATFPGSPSEGDPFAIRIVTTHATAKLVCSRNSLTIDGGTVENYYNLRQVGERLEFVYRNSTWLLVGDGRKPCRSQADQTTTQAISHDTPTMLTLESTVFDTGSIVSLANDNLVPYRGAIWKVVGRTSLEALADQTRQITYLYLNGSPSQIMQSHTTSGLRNPYVVGECQAVVAPGDSVRLGVQWDVSGGTGTKSTNVFSASLRSFFAITEELRRN